jgi:hypothetical protein
MVTILELIIATLLLTVINRAFSLNNPMFAGLLDPTYAGEQILFLLLMKSS